MNVRNFARESVPKLNELARVALIKNSDRVTGITENYNWHRGNRDADTEPYFDYSASYNIDGQAKGISVRRVAEKSEADRAREFLRNKLETQRQQDIVSVRDDFMARAGIPLANSIQIIEVIGNRP